MEMEQSEEFGVVEGAKRSTWEWFGHLKGMDEIIKVGYMQWM